MPTSERTTRPIPAGREILREKEINEQLYRAMLLVRKAELKIAEIYPSDKIQSPIHLCIGQEAISVGVCKALGAKDHIYGTYRGHGLYLGRGGDLGALFAELYGKDTGCARGKGGSMHVLAPEQGLIGCSAIVGSTIPIATGDALASQMRGRKRVAVAFFGDGAVDEGVFFESLNFAALKNLPIVYVCENNNYAVHSRVSDRHKQTELFRFGEGLGVKGQRFDGNDVRVVYSSMREAVEAIRSGSGPLLLEYMTYRMREHVGLAADYAEVYREEEKLRIALKNDPLEKQKRVLLEEFKIDAQVLTDWEASVDKDIEKAVSFAEQSPFPNKERLEEDLFL